MTTVPDFTWLFIKMIVGLVFVLGLALVIIRYILPKTRFGRRHSSQWFRLVDRVPIAPHTHLLLVKILERYFVLGSSERSIQLITELSREEGGKIETA